jgi:hypothetical protein
MSADIGARVYNDGNQNIAASTPTAVTYDQERWDTDGIWNVGNPTRLTSQTEGYYYIAASAVFDGDTLGTFRYCDLYLNGTTFIAKNWRSPTSNIDTCMSISTLYPLEVGDYVENMVYHNSTTDPLALLSLGNYSPEFSIQLVESTGARAIRTAIFDIPTGGAPTVVPWQGEEWDTDGIWNVGQPTRLTCQTPGKYIICASGAWEYRLQGLREFYLLLNGTTTIAKDQIWGLSSSVAPSQNIETIYDLEEGDYIELYVYQNSGVARYLFYDRALYLSMHRVCAEA